MPILPSTQDKRGILLKNYDNTYDSNYPSGNKPQELPPEAGVLSYSSPDLNNGTVLTLNTTGSFGPTGPEIAYFDTYAGRSSGENVGLSDHRGSATVELASTESPVVISNPSLPFGKGIAMGSRDATFISGQNDSSNSKIAVLPAERYNEAFVHYKIHWPAANRIAAENAGVLDANCTWQAKTLWHMFGDNGSSNTSAADMYNGFAFWFSTGSYWTEPRVYASNDGADISFAAFDEFTPIRDTPTIWQSYTSVPPIPNTFTGTEARRKIVDQGVGLIDETTWLDQLGSSPAGATSPFYDRMKIPGFVRGFHISEGANLTYGEIYYATGAGAQARVELCDSAVPASSSEISPQFVSSWNSNEIQIEINKGWAHDQSLTGKYLHVYALDNTFLGAVQL